ncbi:MAG: 1-deoxy-D-xylulose-5-phosphate reductoisomerase [Treponema sp.]|jgi:1-deoxy-D-xylulose-5-phosphate reductoisomerase|nr:1-deoxy-D-xylulose-5-phosphate reductoisomerase [Treponema sp.]
MRKKVALLGATGSIGKSTLDVLRRGKDMFEVVLFSSHTDRAGLEALGAEFPDAVLALSGVEQGGFRAGYVGSEGLLRAISGCGADIVVNGIAGAAGLAPSVAALEAGIDLALANKETIVMAGPLIRALAQAKKARILPVDSEHSAIFQLLEAHGRENLATILLTASGGPFRAYTQEQLGRVQAQDALKHPTWNMGAKITIDSASMANKGLEVIEAVRLFDIPISAATDVIQVLVHPQSIVHSMISLKDGAIYAQLSRPDMRLPIQNALYYPVHAPLGFEALDFKQLTLSFEQPDGEKFPMVPLAYQALSAGDLYPVVYNAANEVAVAAFLAGQIRFPDIARVVALALEQNWDGKLEFDAIRETDSRARSVAKSSVNTLSFLPIM